MDKYTFGFSLIMITINDKFKTLGQ